MRNRTSIWILAGALTLLGAADARAGNPVAGCDTDFECTPTGQPCMEAFCNLFAGPVAEGSFLGFCDVRPVSDGTTCDDGNFCTQSDSCQTGSCTGSDPVVCTPQDQCYDAGVCDPASGSCSNPPKAFGESCNAAAGPVPGVRSIVTCDEPDTCDGAGACNANVLPDGSGCDDFNACTQIDTCQTGVCTGGSPVVCTPGEVTGCTATTGVCDTSSGTCATEPATPGTACGDTGPLGDCDAGDTCDENGVCQTNVSAAGDVCRPGSPDCDAEEQCDGTSIDCPADVAAADGDPCGDSADTDCDDPDTCLSGACNENLAAIDTPCGDLGGSLCNAPDSCDDAGACLSNLAECGLVTGGGVCLFDKNPAKGACDGGTEDGNACVVGDGQSACVAGGGDCLDSREFRLVYTPDVKLWPAHKLNASNPGQFRFNVFASGTPGETQTTTISIPFPFVTQGAIPVHLYDALSSGSDPDCFADPGTEVAAFAPIIAPIDWTNGGTNASGVTCNQACGPLDGPNAARCTFDVEYEVPASGTAYIQVHLDYGLKGVLADGNPCDQSADRYDPGALDETFGGRDALENNSSQNGPVRIANFQPYDFGFAVDGIPAGSDTVDSQNEFKKIAGVLGLVTTSADGSGIASAKVELLRGGKLVARTTTDGDGYYVIPYRHKGKAATFTVVYVGTTTLTKSIQLKANGWAEVNFDASTGAASAQTGAGALR